MSLMASQQKDHSMLQDISNKLGPDQDINQGNSTRSASVQLCHAKENCKKHRNNSYKLCQELLERLAEDIIKGDTTQDKKKILKCIKTRENRQCMYLIMR
eukprot:15365645-Ditylum_brightwellii.AAC.2